MREVHVAADGKQYDIHIGHDLLGNAHSYFARYRGRHASVICDVNTDALYYAKTKAMLEKAGLHVSHVVLPSGESTKSVDNLLSLYDSFLSARINRSDVVVALGGGVIGDLAGFAASTFMRGVHFVQIPTTLLAQVDSSVGGKVAVNHPRGKNLIGSFFQPNMVLADIDTLRTLDARQLGAGLGEVVKYGCIYDAAFFERLLSLGSREALWPVMDEIVARCCTIKAEYVGEDPLDRGIRMQLNFGHTLGHALENVLGYGTLLHGEGVCIGMVAASEWGEKLGVTERGTTQRIVELLKVLDLPYEIPQAQKEAVFTAMQRDKKAEGERVHLVLLEKIGKAIDYPIEIEKLHDLI